MWVEHGSTGHTKDWKCWFCANFCHQPAVCVQQPFASFLPGAKRWDTEPWVHGDDAQSFWAGICIVAAWLLYCGMQNPHSLKCVSLKMRSCLHPPCCVGGQLRHLGTGSPKMFSAEQGTKPASQQVPVLYHPASHHVCSFSKGKGFWRGKSASAENGRLVGWAISCPPPCNQSWIPSLFEAD